MYCFSFAELLNCIRLKPLTAVKELIEGICSALKEKLKRNCNGLKGPLLQWLGNLQANCKHKPFGRKGLGFKVSNSGYTFLELVSQRIENVCLSFYFGLFVLYPLSFPKSTFSPIIKMYLFESRYSFVFV